VFVANCSPSYCDIYRTRKSGLHTSAALLRLELIVVVEGKEPGVESEAVSAGFLNISRSRLAPEVNGEADDREAKEKARRA
jgi:hypothetical protein